jgi:phosphoribosylpyrophosphate synthetase
VLVDDIVSTARTMIDTVTRLRAAGLEPPLCIGVHAVGLPVEATARCSLRAPVG